MGCQPFQSRERRGGEQRKHSRLRIDPVRSAMGPNVRPTTKKKISVIITPARLP